jgi:Cd2+/Zn2+-exporting ATPase
LSILLVTCADDIAVAIPLAFTAAIGTAAKWGIIIKGGEYLESLAKLKVIVFDKTGTLTEGKMKVQNFMTFNNYSRENFLEIAGTMENKSNHPVARTINQFASSKAEYLPITEVNETPGFGISGKINGQLAIAGSLSFLKQKGVKFSENEEKALTQEKNQNRTIAVFSLGGKPIGFVSISDNLKSNARSVVGNLKEMGVEKMIMLTGDNEKVAKDTAEKIGLDDFKANLLPENKIQYLKDLIGHGREIAMVGDGVNDAPALAEADIGIAMGAIGSDAAIENAEIILMKDNLRNIADAINLSRYTMKIVYQNFFLWGIINAVGLILIFGHILGPSGAAAYNFITDFLPLLNSLKLFRLHRNQAEKFAK